MDDKARLSQTQRYELSLVFVAKGMSVNRKMSIYRTYLSLVRRGYATVEPDKTEIGWSYFEITDSGRDALASFEAHS